MPRLARRRALTALLPALGLAVAATPAAAVNTVTTANGLQWQVHDAASPALDTGALRTVTGNAFYGYGGIKVRVFDAPATDPSTRFNGEELRGFGLTYDGIDAFTSTKPVVLDGISVTRTIKVSKPGSWTRWLDGYTNTTDRPITLQSSFGGTLGINTVSGGASNQSFVVASSSGDQVASPADSWVEVATGTGSTGASGATGTSGATGPTGTPGPSLRAPSATVLGTPAPFGGALQGLSEFERSPFAGTKPTTGLAANFYGFRNQLTLQPGQTLSLLHFAISGTAETAGTSGQQIAAVRTTASSLASAPDLTDIPSGQRCSVANFNVATTTGFDPAACATAKLPDVPAKPRPALAVTTSSYDVLDKSLTQLGQDMAAGTTTSQQITRAYLDRIAAYDQGPFGFHTFITVAGDAMAQAKAADAARASGKTGDLLGVPVIIKDLYDTKDMPTTDGSLAFDGFRPAKDAFQVARLRAAGAVILGKGNLSEFANSGSYSESGYMMTANAFGPSRTSLGSSGGPAVATALSLAAFGMGTQTGVSLYAPSTGASLVSLRGTDGISSGSGVMPLTYLQDFEGPIARTTSDIARILNVTTGTDPNDPATVHADADAKRPADWTTALNPGALAGKRIGYIRASFDGSTGPTGPGGPAFNYAPTYGSSDGTGAAAFAKLQAMQDAGATLVEMTTPQPATAATRALSGSRTEEGWQHYFDQQVDPPYHTAAGILSSPRVLPYNRGTQAPAARLTASDVDKIITSRDQSKANFAAWMDSQQVDAVVYPGFRSDTYGNDGAQSLSSDRITNVPTSNFGLPTLILPVGANPDGDPMSLQIVGKAFDDAKVLGFGYALEQQLGGKGHLLSPAAPPLAYDPTATPTPITTPEPVAPVTSAPQEPSEEAIPQPGSATTVTTTTTTTTPGTAPTTTPAAAPKLSVTLPRTARLRGGKVKVTLRNTGKVAATGTVTLTRRTGGRTVVLGRAAVTVRAGRTRTINVTLLFAGKRALAGKKRLAIKARFTLVAGAGTPSTKTVGVTVRP